MAKTEPYGNTIVVTKPEDLFVSDERLEPCDVEFGGVVTDVYQRTITTERIEVRID